MPDGDPTTLDERGKKSGNPEKSAHGQNLTALVNRGSQMHFEDFKKHKIKDAVVDCRITIRYSAGQPTSLVQFKISYAPEEAHCFPIAEVVNKSHPFMTLDELGYKFRF